jgi:hypothetical protein
VIVKKGNIGRIRAETGYLPIFGVRDTFAAGFVAPAILSVSRQADFQSRIGLAAHRQDCQCYKTGLIS